MKQDIASGNKVYLGVLFHILIHFTSSPSKPGITLQKIGLKPISFYSREQSFLHGCSSSWKNRQHILACNIDESVLYYAFISSKTRYK